MRRERGEEGRKGGMEEERRGRGEEGKSRGVGHRGSGWRWSW